MNKIRQRGLAELRAELSALGLLNNDGGGEIPVGEYNAVLMHPDLPEFVVALDFRDGRCEVYDDFCAGARGFLLMSQIYAAIARFLRGGEMTSMSDADWDSLADLAEAVKLADAEARERGLTRTDEMVDRHARQLRAQRG